MLLGTVISGAGFGAALSGTMRTVVPLALARERAGLLSAFYVEGYLAFSLPAILAGVFAPVFGLQFATNVYGVTVIALALISLTATKLSQAGR
jgi:hypothetical protein